MDAVQHGQIRHNADQRDQELNNNSLCTEDLHRQQEEQPVVAVDACRQLLIGDAVSHIVDAFQIRLTVVRVSLKRIDDPYAQEVHHCRKAVAAPGHPLRAVLTRQQQIDCRHKKQHRKQVIQRHHLRRHQGGRRIGRPRKFLGHPNVRVINKVGGCHQRRYHKGRCRAATLQTRVTSPHKATFLRQNAGKKVAEQQKRNAEQY